MVSSPQKQEVGENLSTDENIDQNGNRNLALVSREEKRRKSKGGRCKRSTTGFLVLSKLLFLFFFF